MPSPLADDTIAAIKRAVSIVDLVGEQVTLTRRGRTFKGLCPFHEDHNPSFDVDPERQRNKCWSCQKSGDIFDFVMQRERVDFREALELLAQRGRVPLPKIRSQSPEKPKQDLYAVMRWAEEEFQQCFSQSECAQPAREYAAKRGLNVESLKSFGIGFAPKEWDWLLNKAKTRRFTPELLEKCGLAIRRDQGPGYFDRFRGRLMFPIRDARGRTIAFGGRILPEFEDEKSAKYHNSPETPIFTKGEHLYGLDRAREAITKARVAVVVEGYTDCILPHQHGLANVVGTLGTALGDRHVAILKRYAVDRIILVYDGDDPGQRAADRALGLVLSQEIDLRVLSLPDDLDPCDFLAQRGAEEFRRGLDSALDALDFKLRRAGQLFDLASVSGCRQALDFVLSTIAAVPVLSTGTAPVVRDRVLDGLAQKLRLSKGVVQRRLNELREQRTRRGNNASADDKGNNSASAHRTDESPVERELLEILLADPSRIKQISEQVDLEEIKTPGFRRILEVSIETFRDGQVFDLDSLRLRLEDRELACRASILAETGREKGVADRRLADVLAFFESRKSPTVGPGEAAGSKGPDSDQDPKRFLTQRYQKAISRQGKARRHATV